MPKPKQKLVQAIYKEIEKSRKGQTIVGNHNTLALMKKGDISPTWSSMGRMIHENGMNASLTLTYNGCEVTLQFKDFENDFKR